MEGKSSYQRFAIFLTLLTLVIAGGFFYSTFFHLSNLEHIFEDFVYALENRTLMVLGEEALFFAGSIFVILLMTGSVYLLALGKKRARAIASQITRELVSSKEWFRELYDIAPVPYVMLSAEAQIRQPNKATLRLYQYTSNELYDASFLDHIYGEDTPDVRQYLEQYKRGVPTLDKEVRIVRKDGIARWVLLSIFPFRKNSAERLGLASLIDITERKEIERAKTEFVSLASHQLRSPLSTMKWYLESVLAEDRGALTEEQKTYIEKIYARNRDMIELVNLLLSASRIEMGTLTVMPQETDISALCRSILDEIAPDIQKKNLTVVTDCDEPTTSLYTDTKLLRIVVQNLLTNAVKYSGDSGEVTLSVEKEGGRVKIAVRDTGYGIPPEDQDKIFTRFFRARNARFIDTKGTGLGLYITKSLVEALGGSISFVSELDKGTTFTVLLPMRYEGA